MRSNIFDAHCRYWRMNFDYSCSQACANVHCWHILFERVLRCISTNPRILLVENYLLEIRTVFLTLVNNINTGHHLSMTVIHFQLVEHAETVRDPPNPTCCRSLHRARQLVRIGGRLVLDPRLPLAAGTFAEARQQV